jgi:hypothetical protein
VGVRTVVAGGGVAREIRLVAGEVRLAAGEVRLVAGEVCLAAGEFLLAAGDARSARVLDTRAATTWCFETRDGLFFFFSPGP